ncbi:DEAD/DEAH box helicase [Mycobacteroides abscessus]|uniref:DEAD/DEAH box helicase n=1 Tax=Mycobacteroides abscessus TaxID=36809 RepID=UPI002103121D|nr:DEAD/DEAH box helicase [Mycobacteroides abscessus]
MTAADSHNAFDQLREISHLTRDSEQETIGRDRLVRFLDTYSGTGPEVPIVDSLCARFGLYPYMSSNREAQTGVYEALAVEFHSPSSLESEGFTFHAQQQHVYQRLMDGESLILSAPTSFGKSAIIDALIASKKWANMVLIVPTVALIDETRRRVTRFRSFYNIVTSPETPFGPNNIIIVTQERFLEIDNLPPIDFFMIDEFYKLSVSGPRDTRATLLNLAWNELRATGAQYYLIGPNVDGLDSRLPDELHNQLVVTNFMTVAVDVEDRSGVTDQVADLKMLLANSNDPTLIFTGSPKKAEDLSRTLSAPPVPVSEFARQVAEWIADNYDSEWALVAAISKGIAIHSGPLPRSIQRIMVRLFNLGFVPLLVCTSTLIEGVNTAAKTVIVFEKKIDKQLIDFFTFSNIRGRAGRMFRHFVGRVVTYMPPPEATEKTVDIPISSQSAAASDAALIQLDFDTLDEASRERVNPYYKHQSLSVETIRRNKGLDPSLQIATADQLAQISDAEATVFSWTGLPTSKQAHATLEFAFNNLLLPFQRTGMNFQMMWGQLQAIRANANDFSSIVAQQMQYKRQSESRSDVVTNVVRFQRNWMGFTIPSMLRGLQTIQAEVLPKRGIRPGNYEFLLREIEALYLPEGIAELEEFGLPIPLGLKLINFGLQGEDQQARLNSLISLSKKERTRTQLSTVEIWILEDVVDGLIGRNF